MAEENIEPYYQVNFIIYFKNGTYGIIYYIMIIERHIEPIYYKWPISYYYDIFMDIIYHIIFSYKNQIIEFSIFTEEHLAQISTIY